MSGGRLTRIVAVTTGVLAIHATVAVAARPQFVSISARPAVLQAGGGAFVVSARVRNARVCRIDAQALAPRRLVNCSSGHITFRGHVPANTITVPEIRSLSVEAYGGSHTGRSRTVQIEILPREQPTRSRGGIDPPSPVSGIDACAPGPECDLDAASQSFQNWGNVAPEPLGDCTFAAAANWEQIVLHLQPNPALIGYEYAKAGGDGQGLSQSSLWSYWRDDGIAGVRLTGLHSYTTTAADVQNGVRDFGAMFVELSFGQNWGFGPYTMPASLHDVVVDGFTPEGPLVVSWGETLQMSWEQWRAEAVGMWGIEAS